MLRKIVPDVVQSQTLVHLAANATVHDAAKLMRARTVGSVVILEAGRLTGIFTERDMVCRVVAEGPRPGGHHARRGYDRQAR